ncbi:MAG: filamentous hemagglutinin family protein [Chthoniobacteraceae bacterium]|jgi:filamentous hemagglutinin family protein
MSKNPYISGAWRGVYLCGVANVLMFCGITGTAVGGDLLRGGYTTSQSAAGGAPGSFTPPSAVQARQNANDILARTSLAINAVRAMETAASKLAISGPNNLGNNPNNPGIPLPNVPNGLTAGGLVVATAATWTGAGQPSETTAANGRTIVTVAQTSPDAVLTWSSFNIGKETTLDFNQSKSGVAPDSSIAFNIVEDPSANPTQILGSIEAPGQVYVINQNGIIFGGSSQVNVHTLVASSLPIDMTLVHQGLLNNPDDQFLFSAISQPAGQNGTPAFTPPASYLANGADGDVTVQAGAQITVPANAANVGGRVALIGPDVDNEGNIYTPDGQTIIAAGLQVGFLASSDAELRGLDVYAGSVSDSGNPDAGVATNAGFIDVPQGDIYMIGKSVDQMGVLDSTTSVTLNGRIDLLSQYNSISGDGVTGAAAFSPQSSLGVVFGPDSVTEVLPDLSSVSTINIAGFTLNSEVNVQGRTIDMQKDSMLYAPNATVNLDAGTWFYQLLSDIPSTNFINNGGQIYLDSGATIYAAGSIDVPAPVDQNIIQVQLLGPELADSAAQRNGILAGQTINVDIRDSGSYDGETWVGTPLVDDVSSFVALIQYTAGEFTINGGTVNLSAGGSVVMQPGSQVNVSGGWIDYQGGMVSTSEVISDGNIYPISEAYPDMVYQGFNFGTYTLSDPKYGISYSYTDPLLDLSHYENSYVSGGNGGSISIVSPSVALDGQLIGSTTAGPRQQSINLSTPNSLAATSMPAPSSISLVFEEVEANASFQDESPTPPSIVFSANDNLPAVGPFSTDANGDPAALPTARLDEVILSPDLFTTDGFGSLKINNDAGDVTLPAGVSLDPGPGGSISIFAANVYLDGSITAPDGSLAFTAYNYSPLLGTPSTQPPVNPDTGHFVLGAEASLNTAGLTVDDRKGAPDADLTPQVDNGGGISIDSYSTDLVAGSVIDVSGGVILGTGGTPSYGNGGSISIAGGQDPAISANIDGQLVLGSELEGYSGAKGGALSISAQFVQIGGDSSKAYTQVISPSFFSQGGFSNITLSGFGGLDILPGTDIDPVITSLVAMPGAVGSEINLVQTVLPVGERDPVSLALKAPGLSNTFTGGLTYPGNLVMGEGAAIDTDPGVSVSLSGGTVAVLGSIVAPGGSISISGAATSASIFSTASEQVPTVDLGPDSVLSTAGVTIITPNAYGYHTGYVLNGGSISVSGNIVAEAGAVLNVSGASSILDITPVQANASATPGGIDALQGGSFLGETLEPAEVDSSGGAINLTGGNELFSDATLLGAAGGPAGLGGTLTISSGNGDTKTALDINVVITQDQSAISKPFYPAGGDAIGHPVLGKNGQPIQAPMGQGGTGNAFYIGGYIAANTFLGGGFNSLNLEGTVEFSGPVSISMPGSITVATGGVIYAQDSVHLSSNYIALGLPFEPPLDDQVVQPPPFRGIGAASNPNFNPTYGTGSLTVSANLIDIGYLSLQDIGKASFIADNGDIRGDGTLDVAGSIFMQAGQIYPATETVFTIAAYDYTNSSSVQEDGSVTIEGSGERQLPLSAGGTLNIYAANIDQDGTLVAPLGTINLGWNGSGTAPVDLITGQAVDATDNLTLGKHSVTSVSAIDPLTGQALIIPYGTNPTGSSWIDPSGVNITSSGVPQKSISLSALNVDDEHGAVIDIKGGGDLLAYGFSPGIGGNNDIIGSSSSFAILPGYQADYAPYDTDAGYNNPSLTPGDQIYVNGSTVLAAGVYTLLPARYALLPGAVLVTPQSGLPAGITEVLPDGGSLVSGYRLSVGQSAAPETSSFELDSGAVLASLATYITYSGNSFLAQGAALSGQAVPRLPKDSGELSFQAINSLAIAGRVESTAIDGGLGGLVDISSPDDIVITGATPPSSTAPNTLYLNATELDSFGGASLLVGGLRSSGADGVTVSVATDDITVDNAGDPLTGSDIILVANDDLTVDQGAEIESTGGASGAEAITLSGQGALLRVSADPGATITRTGVTAGNTAELAVDSDAKIEGGSVILDSSAGTNLNPNAVVHGESIALDSGQISIEFADPGPGAPAPTATSGLILSGNVLQSLFANDESLSLLSYSSIDFYGAGELGSVGNDGEATLKNFSLNAGEIRGYNSIGGDVAIAAQNIRVGDAANGSDPGPAGTTGGTLELNGNTIGFGANSVAVDQFSAVDLNASGGIIADASSGSLAVNGALDLDAPVITGAAGAAETITSSGALAMAAPAKVDATPSVTAGLGAKLMFTGASITDNTAISLPTGAITLHATTGDLNIGNLAATTLDATGQSKSFFDVTQYTNGGTISLIADKGNIVVGADATISVAAQSGGGNAGSLSVTVPNGSVALDGKLLAQGGAGGESGSFALDVGSLGADPNDGGLPSLLSLDATLNTADFDQSRTIDVQSGDVYVDGLAKAANFNLSADGGDIIVGGEIDGSGVTGGTITLQAEGSVTLLSGADLTVAAQDYNDAQKGGSVSLEAGSDVNGVASSTGYVDIEAGSTIDLSVAQTAVQGDLAGTLLLRAPQIGPQSSPTGLQVDGIAGNIIGVSSITAEGYTIFDASLDGGSIDGEEGSVAANGEAFANNTGSLTQSGNTYTATGMIDSLIGGNSTLEGEVYNGSTQLVVEPGAEIINENTGVNDGNLTLANTWDLAESQYRFGPDNVAGVLTLRAANNIVFNFGASLSDGFNTAKSQTGQLYDSPLLPVGSTSWSYAMTSGANFGSANIAAVQSLPALAALTPTETGATGSVLVGYGAPALPSSPETQRSQVILEYYQTIRTGAGSISIYAGGDVQLLDSLATIYSAGVQAPALAGFTLPNVKYGSNNVLGSPQTTLYAAQYSEYGGNVKIVAQNNIAHYLENGSGQLIADSSLELPNNWLYRQGSINASTGQFIAATSWWTDFSNFFEGVGSFGGGNVTLSAGNNIENVDAVIPTNFRMPNGTPNASLEVQLGGGDLLVSAGNDISGGAYYVEQGVGAITAGGQILTNATRETASQGGRSANSDPSTWLPTTLFAGDASFNISAGGNLLLGAVVNPFLLPQGINNSYLNRSYFSTYAPGDYVDVDSLAGTVTIKDSSPTGDGSLSSWFLEIDSSLADNAESYAGVSEPWLRLADTSVETFDTVETLMPPTLRVTAFSGDIDLVGSMVLSPAPDGEFALFAEGSINGLQPNGPDPTTGLIGWGTSLIDLSDADPANIPSPVDPLAGPKTPLDTTNPLAEVSALFDETGSTEGVAGVIETKEALHDPGLLHEDDSTPAYLYADAGDISGMTLFSAKFTDILAGQDITDASFYIQNDTVADISVIAAGRDIIPYDPESALRFDAGEPGNDLLEDAFSNTQIGTGSPNAGDIQINGPGTLEVLAGRNLTLGSGPNNSDGTAVGITSIGNQRNPYLPSEGAQLIVAAGLGGIADGLDDSPLDIQTFVDQVLEGPDGATYFSELAQTEPGLDVTDITEFNKLTSAQRAIAALDLFYLALRDAGRDHNLVGSPGYGNYAAGDAAIADLLPSPGSATGDIDTTAKEITTENGGDIDMLDPSGQITVGINLAGVQPLAQGIFTDDGGNISVYTMGSVNLGTSRIFTLHGGNVIIWSTTGDIDAGNSSKTVATAPPTVVEVDPQSANVETDLQGLATGGGIGVLATVAGVPPGNVDLIAPAGVINAGNAGIRASGNLNLAATQILNAGNIQVGGASSGVPTVVVAAPNLGALSAASGAAAAGENAANQQVQNTTNQGPAENQADSIIDVEVMGYGGGDSDSGG